ncbi:MAG TPA: M48 family metalloprotease [Gemmatimonadaceae bacterium]|nr:M48 family metalloprotease [Gemmatimonadaceae bacterium]
MPAIRLALRFLATAALAGCASAPPPAPPTPAQLAEQRGRERRAAETRLAQEIRLARVAEPLLRAAAPLCGDAVRPRLGMLVLHGSAFPESAREAAGALGYGDALRVAYVAPGLPAERAGLKVGDRIVGLDDTHLAAGSMALVDFDGLLGRLYITGATSTVRLSYMRGGGGIVRTEVPLEPACAVDVLLLESNDPLTFTEGAAAYVTTGMMRFATDDEALGVVLAHEIAHAALRHATEKKRDMSVGGFFGALAGVAATTRGVEEEGVRAPLEPGALFYAPDAESDADHVALYVLALADQALTTVPAWWRAIGRQDAKTMGFAATHPVDADRLQRLERTIEEIRQKRLLGEEILPDPDASPRPDDAR